MNVTTSYNLTAADAPLWNSETHHGPAVSVVTWLFIIAVVLSVTARTIARYAIIHTLRWDDILALLAMVRSFSTRNLSFVSSQSLTHTREKHRSSPSANQSQSPSHQQPDWALQQRISAQTKPKSSKRYPPSIPSIPLPPTSIQTQPKN